MKKVLIYSTPTCSYCKQVKEYLKDNNVAYDDVNVGADPALAKEMVEKSGQMGVPVTIVTAEDGEETILTGFDKDKLSKALGL